ncbi:MAG: glycosyltransferase family 4 protein [Candidatus Eremiobacteraeota bacterium]|nr:glycosyltransferase family 4 protein [Candidatus Eremiobacteraeota bacterium]MBC5804217.1 glycosyltransferase family 4 protein [Candidatus Eremiobacteraeota bacterium]MBC5822292.1 glycosyltransferase family 4 protein [Candidatus Eremiobacteraeota bacterium]
MRGLLAALDGVHEPCGCEVIALAAPRIDPWRFDRRLLWDQVLLPLAARRERVDVLHCSAGTLPLLPGRIPVVATVHDVAWLRAQRHARFYARAYFGNVQRALYARAHTIFVDSYFSRDELLALTSLEPSRVTVLYPGVAADIMQVTRMPDPQPFALVVGTVEVRKNLEVLVRALPQLPGLRLVCVGPFTPYRERIAELARASGVVERVELRGYVSRAALLDLYARATFAAVPSRYEGFGYGAAQALCAGVPLIAARASSLPEIVGDTAALVGPDDVAGWTAAIAQLLGARDAAEASAAGERGAACARFGWAAAARIASAAYGRAVAGSAKAAL